MMIEILPEILTKRMACFTIAVTNVAGDNICSITMLNMVTQLGKHDFVMGL